MTARTARLLTAQQSINLLAFGQASTFDQTGHCELKQKWQADPRFQPSPELLLHALQEFIKVKQNKSSNTDSMGLLHYGMLGWAHQAEKLHGRPPAELLEELKLDFLPITERIRAFRMAERRLVSLLSDGVITAIATPAQLRQPFPGADPGILEPVGTAGKVELATWQTPDIGIWLNGDIREAPGLVPPPKKWAGPLFVEVRLLRSEVARFKRSVSAIKVSASIGDTTRLRTYLVELMQLSPEVSPGKRQVRLDATAAGYRFGVRQFDDAWRRAVEEASAPAWSAKGRKSKQG